VDVLCLLAVCCVWWNVEAMLDVRRWSVDEPHLPYTLKANSNEINGRINEKSFLISFLKILV
jgi:hypothetical protein